jgi:hypothetical protein
MKMSSSGKPTGKEETYYMSPENQRFRTIKNIETHLGVKLTKIGNSKSKVTTTTSIALTPLFATGNGLTIAVDAEKLANGARFIALSIAGTNKTPAGSTPIENSRTTVTFANANNSNSTIFGASSKNNTLNTVVSTAKLADSIQKGTALTSTTGSKVVHHRFGLQKPSSNNTKDGGPRSTMQRSGRNADRVVKTLFGSLSKFRRHFANPLLVAREPGATDNEVRLGERRQQELSEITSKFILRRTNELNKVHLPNKLTMVVCVRMAPLQATLYRHLSDRATLCQKKSNDHTFSTFAAISAMRKLVNHPALLSKTLAQTIQKKGEAGYFLEDVDQLMPPEFTGRRVRNVDIERPEYGGKMALVYSMMTEMLKVKHSQRERIVLVSNFTETLDIFARMLAGMNAKYVRLDGGIAVNKRQRLVDEFNAGKCFAFLLSSKAGGCGLNLIGGNRLILFDPSWNPADDRQAAARIWRDGQKKTCYIYRMLATGSIEEKIFQRQVTKEGLASLVMEEDIAGESAIAQDDVRRLFEFQEHTCSDTHDMLHCKGCAARTKHWTLHPRAKGYKPEDSGANDADLMKWAHHQHLNTVDDDLLKKCGAEHVSYTFSLECSNET